MDLVADIGGTKTVLSIKSEKSDGKLLSSIQRYECRQYKSFEQILDLYLAEFQLKEIRTLSIAVAGPVHENACRLTNLSWNISALDLQRRFNFKHVIMLNDLVASGYGIDEIAVDTLDTIQTGRSDSKGNRALISPGTGLGETIIHYVDGKYIPIPSEGGHADFAPFDGLTRRLWEFLKKTKPRVCVEDTISGPGLFNIYRFLISENGVDPQIDTEPVVDPAPAITDLALNQKDRIATKTIEVFIDLLAAEAGNMALNGMTMGGVYFGGGMLPKFLPLIDKVRFGSIFCDKGAHQGLLEGIPLRIITDTNLPLYGAARYRPITG
jgi:glucokinase